MRLTVSSSPTRGYSKVTYMAPENTGFPFTLPAEGGALLLLTLIVSETFTPGHNPGVLHLQPPPGPEGGELVLYKRTRRGAARVDLFLGGG